MKLVRLNKSDGSWDSFEQEWKKQCAGYDEEFENYASASLGTLANECDDGSVDSSSGVFALVDDAGINHSACFLNSADLKGYQGKVLRVRHLVLSPYYDFEDLALEDYASVLGHCFHAIVLCSNNDLKSSHIKLHYRSPYDRAVFAAFAAALRGTKKFSTIESKGMWLHLTKG